ncbi:MAG TPA: P1 family peptidase [Acidimicrobiales bacterium]
MAVTARSGFSIGPRNDLTDVAGVRVGHHHRIGRGWRTGTTVVLAPPGTVGGVDVRGGGPGTRETDALDPRNLVPHVHAVCLSGGSAYGLAAADGVMAWLEEHHIGYPVGPDPGQVVPIVPAAVLFDLGRGGAFHHRPDAGFGRAAAAAAARPRQPARVVEGNVGAGAGAVAGGVSGGVGSASQVLEDGTTVAALVVVNAAGALFDPGTGVLHGLPHLLPADPRTRRPHRAEVTAAASRLTACPAATNTTIGVVATDAVLSKGEAQKLAGAAQDGLARAVRPAHLLTDGDTFFALATGTRAEQGDTSHAEHVKVVNALLAAGADTVTRAIVRAILAAAGHADRPGYRSLFPSSNVPSSLVRRQADGR